ALAAAAMLLVGNAQAEPRIGAALRARLDGREAGEGRIAISVRLAGGAAALREAGFSPRTGAGDLAGVRATPSENAAVARRPGVRAIEREQALHPSLDLSVIAAGVPAARADFGLDGRGVAVAAIDTGCDLRHADFRGADGKTRIAALLDLATPNDGRHPE